MNDPSQVDVASVLVIALVIGVIPAAIAQRKGHNFMLWWVFGAALFIVALPAAFIVKPIGQAASGQNQGAPAQSNSVVWTHTGERYLLGYTVTTQPCFGIWDREAPGPPIQRFPYSQYGKDEAIQRYRGIEPNGIEIEAAVTLPPPPPAPVFGP